MSQGNAWGWGSPGVLGLFAAAVVFGATFVSFERRVAEPMVDMELMAQRAVWSTNLVAFAIGFAMFGSYVLIPQLVELPAVTGYGFAESTTVAGLILLPSALVMLGAGPLSGWLGSRFGSRLPLAMGGVFALLAYLELALFHETLAEIAFGALLVGIGIGLAFAAMANLVVEAVRQDQTGVATGHQHDHALHRRLDRRAGGRGDARRPRDPRRALPGRERLHRGVRDERRGRRGGAHRHLAHSAPAPPHRRARGR